MHIIGTAHISSASAELAGRLVREVKPNVVFVELDAKRVKRAIPGVTSSTTLGVENRSTNDNNQQSASGPVNNLVAVTSTPIPTNPSYSNPTSPIIDLGSKYVGSAVKNMYGKLESEGFKAGDEFAMSVREGLAIGSTIVLGDRDVEVTLRRLTKALSKTDLRKLFSTDNEVERSMEELFPENLKAQMVKRQSTGNVDSMNVSSMGMDVEVDKMEFQSFVETMKVRA